MSRHDATARARRGAFLAGSFVVLVVASGSLLLAHRPLLPHVHPWVRALLPAGAGILAAAAGALALQRAELARRRRRVEQAQRESARAARRADPERAAGLAAARERRTSGEIQRALLPREIPEVAGYHIEASYLPCGGLGGDFYDLVPLPDGRLLLTVGDVSGKGPAGAIVMAMVQTLFRQHALAAAGPADLLARVNEGFSGVLGRGIFVTAQAAILDPHTHRLTVAGAGHPPLLLLNARARTCTFVQASGMALGIVTGERYLAAASETTIDVADEDAILFYTDGASESAAGLGEQRLRAAAAGAVLPGPVRALERLAADLWQGERRRDDATLVLVARQAAARAPRTAEERTREIGRV